MKAEINEKGILVLQSESEEESYKIYKWYQEGKGRITVPENREDLAVCRFKSLDVAIILEPFKERR